MIISYPKDSQFLLSFSSNHNKDERRNRVTSNAIARFRAAVAIISAREITIARKAQRVAARARARPIMAWLGR